MKSSDDADWLRELFETHAAAVRRFAARRVNSTAVDDVVADVFATAWRQGSPPQYAQAWLLRTASYVIARRYRTEARRLANEHRAATEQLDDTNDAVLTGLQVRAALSELGANDAEILRLAYWDDLTIATIADVLGCSQSAAKVRLHRARSRLQAVLGTAEPTLELTPRESL